MPPPFAVVVVRPRPGETFMLTDDELVEPLHDGRWLVAAGRYRRDDHLAALEGLAETL